MALGMGRNEQRVVRAMEQVGSKGRPLPTVLAQVRREGEGKEKLVRLSRGQVIWPQHLIRHTQAS